MVEEDAAELIDLVLKNMSIEAFKDKVKQSHYRPGQALRVPGAEAPRFQDNRHMKVVRLSDLRTGHLYPQ